MLFIHADKMLCGIALSQMKLRKSRNKTSGLCRGDASHTEIPASRCDVTRRSVDICAGSDVTETENRATVANDAVQSCSIRMTSSFDEQIPLTEGETVNNLKFRVICVYFKEQCSILSI